MKSLHNHKPGNSSIRVQLGINASDCSIGASTLTESKVTCCPEIENEKRRERHTRFSPAIIPAYARISVQLYFDLFCAISALRSVNILLGFSFRLPY
uniref:Uncharacterized protein n=1 Tax=Kalanchoe fedtschenkoi TaxID=63787 RepID=A0A7N1A0P8_KALFE